MRPLIRKYCYLKLDNLSDTLVIEYVSYQDTIIVAKH